MSILPPKYPDKKKRFSAVLEFKYHRQSVISGLNAVILGLYIPIFAWLVKCSTLRDFLTILV